MAQLYGELEIAVLTDEDGSDTGRLYVVRAAPEVLISAELWKRMRSGEHHPDVQVEGNYLYINGVNRSFVYVVDPDPIPQYPAGACLYAHWPD